MWYRLQYITGVRGPKGPHLISIPLTTLAYSATTRTMERDKVIRKMKDAQGEKSLRSYASSLSCSAAYISDIYNGRRDPGPKVLSSLGLEKQRKTTVVYKEKRWR